MRIWNKKRKSSNMTDQNKEKEMDQEINGQDVNLENGCNPEEENTVSQENSENPEESAEETIEEKLAQADAKCADLQDRLLRQMAEFDNYRKRTIKEKAELIKTASADVIEDILPVIDDLERALANAEKSQDFQALSEGLGLIYNKLMHTLSQKGLKKIAPKNEPFDTDFHEAIAMIPAPSEDMKGLVLDCAIDGYMLNEKVLRHAKVAVAQ